MEKLRNENKERLVKTQNPLTIKIYAVPKKNNVCTQFSFPGKFML